MMFVYILNLIFKLYTFMLFARVIGSWIPRFARSKPMRFLGFYTDPYLNLFRRIIPTFGAMDISPMFAFIALQFVHHFVIRMMI